MIFFDRDKKINSIIHDKKLLQIRSIRKLQNMLNKKKIVNASIKRIKNLKNKFFFEILNDIKKRIVLFA